MARLAPYYPALPIMLVSAEEQRSYATFESQKFLESLDLKDVELEVIDLNTPAFDESEVPF